MQPEAIQPNSEKPPARGSEAPPPTAADVETARRHRVLIAAAAATIAGRARIREIRPAEWTRRRPRGERRAPEFRRQIVPQEADLEPEEEELP